MFKSTEGYSEIPDANVSPREVRALNKSAILILRDRYFVKLELNLTAPSSQVSRETSEKFCYWEWDAEFTSKQTCDPHPLSSEDRCQNCFQMIRDRIKLKLDRQLSPLSSHSFAHTSQEINQSTLHTIGQLKTTHPSNPDPRTHFSWYQQMGSWKSSLISSWAISSFAVAFVEYNRFVFRLIEGRESQSS